MIKKKKKRAPGWCLGSGKIASKHNLIDDTACAECGRWIGTYAAGQNKRRIARHKSITQNMLLSGLKIAKASFTYNGRDSAEGLSDYSKRAIDFLMKHRGKPFTDDDLADHKLLPADRQQAVEAQREVKRSVWNRKSKW